MWYKNVLGEWNWQWRTDHPVNVDVGMREILTLPCIHVYWIVFQKMNSSLPGCFFLIVIVQEIRMFYLFPDIIQANLKNHQCINVWNYIINSRNTKSLNLWSFRRALNTLLVTKCYYSVKEHLNDFLAKFLTCTIHCKMSMSMNILFYSIQ